MIIVYINSSYLLTTGRSRRIMVDVRANPCSYSLSLVNISCFSFPHCLEFSFSCTKWPISQRHKHCSVQKTLFIIISCVDWSVLFQYLCKQKHPFYGATQKQYDNLTWICFETELQIGQMSLLRTCFFGKKVKWYKKLYGKQRTTEKSHWPNSNLDHPHKHHSSMFQERSHQPLHSNP